MQKSDFVIMLVEDDLDQAELIKVCFEENNIPCKIVHTIDGEDAIDYLTAQKKYSDRINYPFPDLILLDLKLPKVDGIDVLKFIKNHVELVATPVIMFTSSQNEKDIEQAYINHANSYIVKPLGYNSLSNFVNSLFSYWQRFNTNSH
ncbi:MAG: response regulator [Candidatus Wallbacteria bacterium]